MQRTTIISMSAALALALGSAGALAQTTPTPAAPPPPAAALPATASTSGMAMHDNPMMHKDKMQNKSMGMQHAWMATHRMSGTVTSVDKTTGMVDLNAGGKDLHLHFPPNTLTNLNSGDNITVRLSFRKN